MSTTTTFTHNIGPIEARALCDGRALPVAGLVVARDAAGRTLEVVYKSGRFVARCTGLAPDDWADAFGVLPHAPGRIALAMSERGAWRAARARAQ